jgi:hypothetical protein
MTWAEFLIRCHAYRRIEKRELYLLREMAWVTYVAPHLNPKKMKKSRDAFWRIDEAKASQASDAQRERMKQAQAQYILDLDNNKKKQLNGS